MPTLPADAVVLPSRREDVSAVGSVWTMLLLLESSPAPLCRGPARAIADVAAAIGVRPEEAQPKEGSPETTKQPSRELPIAGESEPEASSPTSAATSSAPMKARSVSAASSAITVKIPVGPPVLRRPVQETHHLYLDKVDIYNLGTARTINGAGFIRTCAGSVPVFSWPGGRSTVRAQCSGVGSDSTKVECLVEGPVGIGIAFTQIGQLILSRPIKDEARKGERRIANSSMEQLDKSVKSRKTVVAGLPTIMPLDLTTTLTNSFSKINFFIIGIPKLVYLSLKKISHKLVRRKFKHNFHFSNKTVLESITNKMTIYFNVFSAFMENRIFGNMKNSLVITIDRQVIGQVAQSESQYAVNERGELEERKIPRPGLPFR
ncbi:hypothetical protein M9H77_27099 [Catharanthus roseus]|uniref:Uncharacterized protein n=1 Tax=Catharanthus roseus TaxID=4058 RepID=A0ACC0AFM2_CATRO|nr:hypothetical protein M9H77_27099 [Catharanthus roseus]